VNFGGPPDGVGGAALGGPPAGVGGEALGGPEVIGLEAGAAA